MKIAVKWMTPVISSPTATSRTAPSRSASRIRRTSRRSSRSTRPSRTTNGAYMPYLDAKLIRPWAVPGTPGLEHRIGGLEKDSLSGMVSYDGMNHERMVKTRAQKIRNVVEDVPDVETFGAASGDPASSSPGTFGAVRGAAEELVAQGKKVATSTCAG